MIASQIQSLLGPNQNLAESIIMFVIGAGILGIIIVNYWRILLAGALGISFICVMANHKDGSTPDFSQGLSQATSFVNGSQSTQDQDDKKAFYADCMSIKSNTMRYCNEVWAERQGEENLLAEAS
jgi:hypothetical protein